MAGSGFNFSQNLNPATYVPITEFIISGSVFDVRSLYRITTTINYCWTMTTVLFGQLSFLFVLPKNIKSIITSLSDYYTASVVHSISSLHLSSPIPTLTLALARLVEKSSRYISIENMSRCLEIKRSIRLIQNSIQCRQGVVISLSLWQLDIRDQVLARCSSSIMKKWTNHRPRETVSLMGFARNAIQHTPYSSYSYISFTERTQSARTACTKFFDMIILDTL